MKPSKTEEQNPRSRGLDTKRTIEILRLLNRGDARVAFAVRRELPKIARAVDAIVKSIRGYLDGCGPSQHLLGNFVADVVGDVATSRTYARVYHRGRADRAHLSLETIGEYVVRWERRSEGWRAVSWELKIFANVGDASIFGPQP